MDLLQYKNRFKGADVATQTNEITGYMWAIADLLQFIRTTTQFDPDKRYIDSVSILNAISETSGILAKKLSGVNLNSPKVKQFLQEQIDEGNDPDDLKHVL